MKCKINKNVNQYKKKNIVFTFNLADLLIEERTQSGHQSAESISFSCDSFVRPYHELHSTAPQTYAAQKCQISYL